MKARYSITLPKELINHSVKLTPETKTRMSNLVKKRILTEDIVRVGVEVYEAELAKRSENLPELKKQFRAGQMEAVK